jgi:hypothetical protein
MKFIPLIPVLGVFLTGARATVEESIGGTRVAALELELGESAAALTKLEAANQAIRERAAVEVKAARADALNWRLRCRDAV